MSPPGAAWDEGFTAAVTGIIEWFRAEAPLLMDEESRAGNYRAAQKIAERFGGTDEQQ